MTLMTILQILSIIFVYYTASCFLLFYYDISTTSPLDFPFSSLLLLTLAILNLIFLRHLLKHYNRGFDGIKAAATYMYKTHFRRRIFAEAILITICIPFFLDAYSRFKVAIPIINPFSWDLYFMEADLFLHFDKHPWQWLDFLLFNDSALRAFDFLYSAGWVRITLIVLLWILWSPNNQLKKQYIFSFLFTWIFLGSFLATTLSCAGPCYFGNLINSENPYSPLMDHLSSVNNTTPLGAVLYQKTLWAASQGKSLSFGMGISAMPSMHVATATLCALAGWKSGRWPGLILTTYLILILVSSILLGWHYAVDGYTSILLTVIVWKATELWLRDDLNSNKGI